MPWDFWLIFLLLGVVVPWRGRRRLRELLAKPSVGPAERISLYVSTIVFQWLAAGVAAWRAWAHGLSSNELGLVLRNAWSVCGAAVLGAVLLAALQWMNLRRISRTPQKMRGPLQALAERILPQSTKERVPFFALAVTAGICEEFLYRGFAMAAFTRAGMPPWSVVASSSILFGLAHLYQGRGGLVGTMLLGFLFGTTRITLGSLIPVTVWHAAVDVVAGVAGPGYLIHNAVVVDNTAILNSK
jgi:membrane protease YdiL (CAAX protease family)